MYGNSVNYNVGLQYNLFIHEYWRIISARQYYEQQLPTIYAFIDEQKQQVLDPDTRTALEEVIPTEGIDYQVVNLSGHRLYGTWEQQIVSGPEELLKHLNTTEGRQGKYVRYYPIMNAQYELEGAIILRYGLNLPSANPQYPWLTVLFTFGNMMAPLVYLALFTFIFGRWLGNRIEPSIAALIRGARRIEQQDLDFSLQDVAGAKELHELGKAFEQMRGTLQETLIREWRSEQERREMVAAITHDLRTPLTIIQGHVEGLIHGGSKQLDRLERYLQTIYANTERAIHLLEEMTELSEIERTDFKLLPAEADIAVFVSKKIEEFSVLCEQKRIAFQSTFEDSRKQSRPMILDAHRLNRMVDNVMANSMRFTPEGGTIEWHTSVTEGKVAFTVTDSGPGFSEKDLRQMFQRFYQGDPSRSTEKGHAGLGLSIVRTLTEKHGGGIEADNVAGGGARIRLWVQELDL